jgi:hypothetical protein
MVKHAIQTRHQKNGWSTSALENLQITLSSVFWQFCCVELAIWMDGEFMWNVLFNRLKLTDDDIIAMTTVNFTGATDPNNISSVYQGVSTFTRCVWEIKLGNVVSSQQFSVFISWNFI